MEREGLGPACHPHDDGGQEVRVRDWVLPVTHMESGRRDSTTFPSPLGSGPPLLPGFVSVRSFLSLTAT